MEDSGDIKKVIIREAKEKDCEQIAILIQELANHEEMPNGPKIRADTLRRDGFGEEKLFRCLVAEDGDKLVGHALYFFNYSSWEGANVYLEDLYVTPEYRHKGIGTSLMQGVAKIAVDRKCNRMDWVCLGWIERSVEFYKSKGARNITQQQGWNLFRLSGDELKTFSKQSS